MRELQEGFPAAADRAGGPGGEAKGASGDKHRLVGGGVAREAVLRVFRLVVEKVVFYVRISCSISIREASAAGR